MVQEKKSDHKCVPMEIERDHKCDKKNKNVSKGNLGRDWYYPTFPRCENRSESAQYHTFMLVMREIESYHPSSYHNAQSTTYA